MPASRACQFFIIAIIAGFINLTFSGARAADSLASPSSEQPPDELLQQLPDVTVTSTPVVQDSIITPFSARVDMVGQEQIESMNAQDLADALRRVPGVSISRFNRVGSFGGGAGGAVFIRGHGSGRPGGEIGTQIDGIPRVNSVWSHPLLDTLSLDVARHIEVRKSPDPVFSGNMGFATINLVPKRAETPGWQGRSESTYGTYETRTQKLELGIRHGPVDAYLAGSHRKSDGHRDNSGGEVNSLYGMFGWRPAEQWDITFLVNHTEGWADDPGSRDEPSGGHTERYSTDAQFYVLTLGHDFGFTRGHVKFYYEDGWAKWKQNDDQGTPADPGDDTIYWHYPSYTNWGVHLRETVTPWEKGNLTLGIDWDTITGKAYNELPDGTVYDELSRITMRRFSPYFMLAHTLGETIAVTPSFGGRWTDTRYFGSDWGFQAGITIQYASTKLFANYALARNYPGIYTAMFYNNFWSGAPGNAPDGWKDLGPERLDHWEMGISQSFGELAEATFSIFYDKVRDGLRIVPPPPPPPAWRNVGDYTTKGGELSLRLYPAHNFDLFIGTAYMQTDPDDVPNAPDWKWTAGAEYRPTDRLTLNLDTEYVGSREIINTRIATAVQQVVDSYLLVNARIGYSLTKPENPWSARVFLAADNLTDEQYEYQPGYPMPGTTLTAGLDLRF